MRCWVWGGGSGEMFLGKWWTNQRRMQLTTVNGHHCPFDGRCPDHGTSIRMFGEAIASPQASFSLTEILPGTPARISHPGFIFGWEQPLREDHSDAFQNRGTLLSWASQSRSPEKCLFTTPARELPPRLYTPSRLAKPLVSMHSVTRSLSPRLLGVRKPHPSIHCPGWSYLWRAMGSPGALRSLDFAHTITAAIQCPRCGSSRDWSYD